jgi:hypothetical protein
MNMMVNEYGMRFSQVVQKKKTIELHGLDLRYFLKLNNNLGVSSTDFFTMTPSCKAMTPSEFPCANRVRTGTQHGPSQ